MGEYKPKLALGVEHSLENLDRVKSRLENLIEPGTIVGTEAYSHPISYRSLYRPEGTAEFFDEISDFIVSKGGIFVPLQTYKDMSHRRMLYDDLMAGDYFSLVKKLREGLRGKAIDANITDLDVAAEYMATHREHPIGIILSRLLKRLFLKYGYDLDESRDDSMIRLAKEKKPEIIVFGYIHIPSLMVEFPDMSIELIVTGK
ncbi:hypothetical protein HYU23_01985 [Candidatus Woesearchaeota archaeon]|nr:hypothetical protein [Candidatus Woesearchaeota archaeon]